MTPARRLKALQEKFRFRLKPSLSQHFLVDPAVLQRVASAVEAGPDDCVVEVGAGAGFLTERLLDTGARVVAIEVDEAMVELLRDGLGKHPRLEIINADMLRVDMAGLLAGLGVERCVVAGNLPYHITTPVLFHLVPQRDRISRMVLMVQREVGIRMAAGPGGKEYGALSVGVAYGCSCEKLFEVGPGAFIPRPKVRSAVLRLVPVEPRLDEAGEGTLFALVRAAFGQRRKMLVNAVAEVTGGRDAAREALVRSGIEVTRRGETLSLDEFIVLAKGIGHGLKAEGRVLTED